MAIIWFLIFLLALLMECATVQLVSIWFCLGSMVSLILSFNENISVTTQIAVFVIVSTLSIAIFYPLISKKIKKNTEHLNADSIIGKDAIVVKDIDNLKGEGQIKINGMIWSATSKNDTIIKEQEIVTIIKISGVKAIVERTGE